MYFDTHCHLTLCDHISLEKHINLIRENHLVGVLDPGISLEDFPNRFKNLQKYPEVIFGIAIAPHEIKKIDYGPALKELENWIKKESRIKALSEIGLEYFHVKDEEVREKQREVFLKQLLIAKKNNLAVFLHIREAFEDAYEIVKKSGWHKGAVHCFTGGEKDADKFLDLGFHISFSGIITFKKSLILQKICQRVPLDRMLTETDAPYLAPIPYRGKKNLAIYLKEINCFISSLRSLEEEKINLNLLNNIKNLLSLDGD